MININLTSEDKSILKAVYTGHDTIVDIIDFIGTNTENAMDTTDKLEILGYLERCANSYIDYLKFRITDKGKASLPEMNDKEKLLAEEYGISKEDYIILKEALKLGRKKNNTFELSDNTGLGAMKVVTCADTLERKGYVKMVGQIRRYLVVTPEGEKLLKNVG